MFWCSCGTTDQACMPRKFISSLDMKTNMPIWQGNTYPYHVWAASTDQHRILLLVYWLTGCETHFMVTLKRTVFRIMMQKANTFQAFSTLGSGPITKAEWAACTQFVGLTYRKSECVSLNQLRVDKAEHNTRHKKLPPTEDSLSLHIERCIYQLMMWTNVTAAQQVLPDPTNFGYERDATNQLQPKLTSQPLAAPERTRIIQRLNMHL